LKKPRPSLSDSNYEPEQDLALFKWMMPGRKQAKIIMQNAGSSRKSMGA